MITIAGVILIYEMLPGQTEQTLVTLRSQVSPKSIKNQDAHDFAHNSSIIS